MTPAEAQLRAWGADPAEIERLAATLGPSPVAAASMSVLPSCRAALDLWVIVAGQWRMASVPIPAGLGAISVSRPVALDLTAVEAAARMAGIAMTPPLLGDLRCIEQGALGAFAERQEG